MRVFLDTNVLVAAAISRGLCAELLATIIQSHEWITTSAIRKELERVLREQFPDNPGAVATFLEIVDSETELVPLASPGSDLPDVDPDEIPHLEAAAAGGTQLFVTGDRELLGLELFRGVPIRSPRGAWPLLRAKGSE